jgi:GWxTD domain-containing protein
VLAAAGELRGDDAPAAVDLPLESDGHLRFCVDAAAFRADGGRTELAVSVSVSNDQLEFREAAEGTWSGRLRMRVSLRDVSDTEIFAEESLLEPVAASRLDAADRAIVQSLSQSAFLAAPGLLRLEVHLTDENAVRTGLLNKIRKKHKEGTAAGWIEVRDLAGDGLVLSDLALLRRWRPAPGGGRHGIDYDPNPQRFYGLVLPMARYYLEVYAGSTFQEGDPYLVQVQLIDGDGVPRGEKTTRALPRGRLFVLADELRLPERIVAGTYRLDVTVLGERTRDVARVSEPLEVVWSVASWGRDPMLMVQEMALIMTESEHRTLRGLNPGAQEVYLAEYWHELDPDPDTPENEVLDDFRGRVRHADQEFGSTLTRGVLTDRGRVWVRYGPPDDIVYEFSSSSFGADGNSERIADPAERATLRARPSTSFLDADEFREGDVSDVAEQRGGTNIKAKQLEIWTYDGPGYPLTDRVDRGPDSHRGLKFIFADEMDNGNYTLIGSTGATIY